MTVRVTAAVIMFIFSFALCVSSNLYTNSALTELYEKTSVSEDISEEEIRSLCDTWKDKREALSVFLKHTEADMLDRFFSELEILIDSGTGVKERMRHTVEELKGFLSVIIKTEKPEIENIF